MTICGDTGDASAWLLWGLLAGGGLAFAGLLRQRRKAHYRADAVRTLSWAGGVVVLLIALWPPLAQEAHYDFRQHMLQHLLIGMVAPLGLVGAAPLTQLLRTLPPPTARRLMRALRSPEVRTLSHPVAAGLLNTGSLYLLYLTPLYAYTLTHPGLHALVHLHFLLAGCLFVWSLVHVDPVPHRPRFSLRVTVLVVSIAAHAFLSKAMYAYGWPLDTWHPPDQIRQAAQWMYYGGDAAEVLLVVVLFGQWYRYAPKKRLSFKILGDRCA